jgi:protein-L-isoaspartate O-methyltransferase
MKLSPKQTALIQTFKLFSIAVLAGVLINVAFAYFTIVQVGIGFALAVLAALVKFVYDLELSKAEHQETLKELNKKG